MSPHRIFIAFLLLGLIAGVFGDSNTAKAQSMSAAVGPYQMIPSGSSVDVSSTYPSTATPGSEAYAVPSYPSTSPALMASAPNDTGVYSTPSMPSEPGALPVTSGFDAPASSQSPVFNGYAERNLISNEPWSWQILPSGLMYKPYLASPHEPRFGSTWVHDRNQGWLWDVTLGGRAGLIRYGSDNDFWPQGYQLDIEGAAFPRLDHNRELVSNDYRFGCPFTMRQGAFEGKFGYYHLSSHLGDEYMLLNPGNYTRLNYVRESLLLGMALYVNPSIRLYTEVGYAFHVDGGAEPWEFQFGIDCSSAEPTGFWGAPFFAINSHLRQENDFSGNLSVQTGWQWRGRSGHLCRIGMQYFNGMSSQYQFYDRFEEQIGAGIWYDF